jgi:hypothetical protein
MTAAKTCTHLNCHPNHVVFVKSLIHIGQGKVVFRCWLLFHYHVYGTKGS